MAEQLEPSLDALSKSEILESVDSSAGRYGLFPLPKPLYISSRLLPVKTIKFKGVLGRYSMY